MIRKIEVRNFQSLHSVDIEMGSFTVVVGASSSGKSALLRALRLVAHNAPNNDFVTHGRTSTSVSIYKENDVITVERGKAISLYHLNDETFAKCGTDVPHQVAAVLKLGDKGSPNFALQFDRPFLLDEPGSKSAAVVGDLTKTAVVMDAAREGNRRLLGQRSLTKTREADVEALKRIAGSFIDLQQEREAIERDAVQIGLARTRFSMATTLRERLGSLEAVLGALRTATLDLENVPKPPSENLLEMSSRLQRATESVRELRKLRLRTDSLFVERGGLQNEIEDIAGQVSDLLESSGICPLCGGTVAGQVRSLS